MPTENPFKKGDRVLMKAIIEMADRTTAEQYAVEVLDVGTCDETFASGGNCNLPTIHFNDPESGEPDEAHAEDFLPC